MITIHTKLTPEQREDYENKMYRIVGLAMKLYNEIGFGYAEPIYQECLSVLCDENNIPWQREKQLTMYFHQKPLKKEYQADFVCYDDIIVELKAVTQICNEHRAQLFNYLRITQLHAGILINFGDDQHLHSEKYLYNPTTDRFELITYSKNRPYYYPGTNIPYSTL